MLGSVKIYNSAGELVATLYQELPLYKMPVGLSPLAATFAPDENGKGVLKLLGPDLPLIWSGSNDAGQYVNSGIYSVIVQVKDLFGTVTTWSESLTVLRTDVSTQVEVYNSAGEMVWHQQAVPQAQGLVGVSDRQLVPEAGNPGLKITYGSGSLDSMNWNGTGSNGQALSSGTYMVKVTQGGKDGKTTSSFAVALLQPNVSVFAFAAAAPNPVLPGTTSIKISLQNAAPGITAWGEAYNLAGEHVGSLALVAGGNITWNIPPTLAGGVYMLRISAKDNQGHFKTAPVKVALLR